MQVEFLFFRHGETDWNHKGFFQGHSDIPLNERGQQQALELAEKVQHWLPDVVLSSDLIRAVQTAEACLKKWKKNLLTFPHLREIHLGQAEGLHRDSVQKLVGEGWQKWISEDPQHHDFRFPDGESKREAKNRVESFLVQFLTDHPHYKKIAVSTHGGIVRRMTSGLPGTPSEGLPIPNCVHYFLDYKSGIWTFKAGPAEC